MQNINTAVENAVNTDGQPVILTSPVVRPHLAQLITRFLPSIPVISPGRNSVGYPPAVGWNSEFGPKIGDWAENASFGSPQNF